MLPTKFGVETKNRFSRWRPWRHGHLGFPIGTILAIFIYKSPRCFLSSFMPIGLSVQEKKRKIDSQDSSHGGHLEFPIRTILDLQVTLMLSTMIRQLAFWFRRRSEKIDFQDGDHGSHLGFPIGTNLAYFDL